MIFAAALLALAACNNEENGLADTPMKIRLSSGIEVQARATTDIQSEAFDTDEKVDVFISEAVADGQTATTNYAQPLTYTAGTKGALNIAEDSQPYFPSSGNGVNIYAVYPSGTEDGIFKIERNQSDDASYKASDLMYGTAENPVSRTKSAVPITFKHLLSKVTVKLVAGDGLTDAKLESAQVKLLDVSLVIPFDASKGSIGNATGESDAVIVCSGRSQGSAVIPPQTLPEEFVRVALSDGGVLMGKLNDGSKPVLESGNEYTYTITVNLTSLAMTASITPWKSNTSGGNAEMK